MNIGRAIACAWLAMIVLVCWSLLHAEDRARSSSISKRILCTCGCREVLSECSHRACARKPPMMQEISAAIAKGKNDQQILDQMSAEYGADILLVPSFRGFDTMLWIAPIALGFLAVGGTLIAQRRRISKPQK